jgi:DNA-binding LytR/AlgR family response regulator
MINVGICDDETIHRELLSDVVCKALFQFGEVQFYYYSSGEKVIEEIESDRFVCELLLLDINMPGRDGLETAAFIRKHKIDVDIIFVTVSPTYVFDGYTYQAFSYLLKPVDQQRMVSELERYMKLKEFTSRCLHVNVGGRKVQIFLDRVKYFAADGRKIEVCQLGEGEEISFYAKIGDLQETLQNDDFLRCHQSYLVNTKYVQSFTRTTIDVGGNTIPVSRRYVEDVKKKLNHESGVKI